MRDKSFPPYSYVPGLFPHPMSDPNGHGFEVPPCAEAEMIPDNWQMCSAYLRGIDLFNHGYYWESHECWENVWNRVGRRGMTADFVKALIKIAAALVKAREGKTEGVRRHASRASDLLSATNEQVTSTHFMGLSLRELSELAKSVGDEPERWMNTAPEPVVCFDEFQLVTTLDKRR